MKYTIFFALIFFLFSINITAQSKIKKAEDSLKKEDSKSNNSENNVDYESSSNDNTTFFEAVVGEFFIKIFAYTVYGVLIESPFEANSPSSHAILTKHPYLNSNSGNYDYETNENSAIVRTTIASRFIFENPTLKGNHLNVDMRFYNRFALELNYLQLWEDNTNFGTDNLAIYTLLGKYHRIRSEKFDAWWGLGASYVDGEVNKLGVTYGLGAELFFAKPISLESNFNQTFINSETVNKFNMLLNFYKKNYKFTGGYEHLKIGNQKFSTMSLGVGLSF